MIDLSNLDMDLVMQLPLEDQEEILNLLKEKEEYERYNKIEDFKPYPFQLQFFNASSKYKRRFLCAANRIGKSYSEATEFAQHLSGDYQEWWDGHRFEYPVLAWAVGITTESTRKVSQKELFGTDDARDTKAIGTGAIPRKYIDFESMARDGQRIISVRIKHHTKGVFDGWSTCEFRSTSQGEVALMGATVDYIWMDEEDEFNSIELYSQCVTRTATTGGLVTITATPEQGLTKLVDKFMTDDSGFLYFQNATWDDAFHLTDEVKKELLASIPEWQHEMRSKGLPILGSGLIYPIQESSLRVEPFAIPDHWVRIGAVDIGITHDTAAVWAAWDPETDTIYVYDAYHAKEGTPHVHAPAIKARGNWIPIILPHDADNTERGSGKSVANYYREAGVNCQAETFYNPMEWDGKRTKFVEPGIMHILQRMKSGRLKIFTTCHRIFEEMRRYHRKDGKIVKEFDDTMDAMRYCVMSLVANRGISKNEGVSGYDHAYADNWRDFNVNY